MRVLDDYFEALRTHNWELLGTCLAESVHRTGPYLDVVQGKRAYIDFLARVIPALPNYELKVRRIRKLSADSAVVELSEILDLGGVRTEFPEVLLFDFDATGVIARVDIYIKQRGGPRR